MQRLWKLEFLAEVLDLVALEDLVELFFVKVGIMEVADLAEEG